MFEGNIVFFYSHQLNVEKEKWMHMVFLLPEREREREWVGGRWGRKRKKCINVKITTLRNLIADNITQTSDILFH